MLDRGEQYSCLWDLTLTLTLTDPNPNPNLNQVLDRGEPYSCLWDLRASRIAPELLLFARMAGPLWSTMLTRTSRSLVGAPA